LSALRRILNLVITNGMARIVSDVTLMGGMIIVANGIVDIRWYDDLTVR